MLLLALLALTFFRSLSSLDAVSVIYKRSGGEVVIPTGSEDVGITSITWKHNEDIAVEWYGGELSAYRHFNGRTTLDTSTGALTISGLTRDHSGSYTAEVNNKVAGTTEVRVISPVPKPTVSKWCDAEMTYCTLICEGNTTDTELVTYSWQIFDVHNYYKGQQVNITKEDPEPWFRCEMKNPISAETSEEFKNPFSSRNRMFTIILVLGMILLLIGLVGGICICFKCNSKKENSPKKEEEIKFQVHSPETPESNNETENTRPPVSCNGLPPSLSMEETSTLIPKTSSVVPDISSQTEISSKEEVTQALIHGPETPESNDQIPTTTSEGQETLKSVAESSNESATDSQDQKTNDLKTAASPETEESAEESNGKETTGPLLEERNQSISVST